MKAGPWTTDEVETLQDLIADGYTHNAAAKVLRRSENAITAKLAAIRCKPWFSRKGSGVKFSASFETPPRRQNDDHKHLTAILKAHGKGFPVCGGSR